MNYPAKRINDALGIDPDANLADALAAIEQLRAHVATAEVLRAERNEAMRALDKARDERDEARQTAIKHREAADRFRAELKQALENSEAGAERDAAEYRTLRREFDRAQDDAADLRATLANTDRFAQRMQRERDTAYAVLHHLTGEFAP